MPPVEDAGAAGAISVAVFDEPGPLRHVWTEAEPGCAFPFQRYEFVATWCRVVAPATAAQPRIVLVSRGGRPLMLLPLCIRRTAGTSFLEFMDGGVSDYNAPILCVPAADLPPFAAVWARLLAALPALDGVRLRRMPVELGEARNPMLALGARADGEVGHYLDLVHDRAAARSLSKEGARKLRRLQRHHVVALVEDGGDAAALRELIGFRQAKYGWNPDRHAAMVAFYGALLGQPGIVRFYRLQADGRTIAAQLAFTCGSSCTGVVIGYDLAWADASPGRVLLAELIERLSAGGFAVFDSGHGDEAYKREYCSHRRTLHSHEQALTTRGHAWMLTQRALRRAYWAGRAGLRRLIPASAAAGTTDRPLLRRRADAAQPAREG